jgi:hypothetical protein
LEIKFLKKFSKKLKEKDGSSIIYMVVIFLIAMILLSISYEFIRMQIIANNIRDAYERSILTVAADNYNEVYAGFRDKEYIGGEFEGGPAGGGDKNELAEWVAMNDYGNIKEELMELLSLKEDGRFILSDKDKYKLSDMKVEVKNGEYSSNTRYQIKGTLKLTIPFYFNKVFISDIVIPIHVNSAYTAKY